MFQGNLLKDERVLITGGGTGLGKSMGRRMLELGAELVICGRRAGVLALHSRCYPITKIDNLSRILIQCPGRNYFWAVPRSGFAAARLAAAAAILDGVETVVVSDPPSPSETV